MPLVSMRDVQKSFSGVPALVGASLEIGEGEVMALIGQNGAGKSTLIKILTGAYRRDGGSIAFAGRAVDFASPGAAQAAGIATIYQEINLVAQRSVAENIFLGREKTRFGLIDRRAMAREAEELLSRFGLAIDVSAPLGRFNAATRQMVAIARALSMRARLVIMDESTSSLDEREVETLFATIRTLAADGVAVLFVSHRMDELYAVCDRVTVMRDGQTVGLHRMADIAKIDLVTAMLGRTLAAAEKRLGTAGAKAASGPLIEARGLVAGRRLNGASVSVGSGEVVALAGLLGSGRTETARIVFGADRPDAGTLVLDGRDRVFAGPADAIAEGFGFCTEDRKIEGIVPDMSVAENLTLALMPRLAKAGLINEAAQRKVVDHFIQRLGIKLASPDQKIKELSGGNQQKVLLARWLAMNPRLLIVDEPTRGIDVGAKAEILTLLRELAAQGLGVLMISSEIEEVLSLADRVTVLGDGRTVAQLDGAGISESAILSAMAAEAPRLPGGLA
ncbi:sugar ABC transporter ATP-binding protein [Aureimonas sp. Leaf454]|uniref:sugar ABC transporter ATP-binding protein n=1 Tax=Aureimonas sp. Leaf454 TaxID=1736381 RepID=UPI0006F1EB31|nr:sugar ABC transporter ATP-binding protein [Aureimonas sp. Leaf454]KQT44655.1 sugar ABC transporter ATP-binding protein [Aureimonas sp. Leaf454]